MGVGRLVGLGLVIHSVLLMSIFDIYFTSPIISNVEPLKNVLGEPPCKRVVFISVDGLRLDALLENDPQGLPVAPYIRSSMDHRGTWGTSHTHLPTESRPGHIALLAGLYEDPSAVTRGWKENPVDFDSIFNQSSCSFAWGSPDIVNIFYKGLNHNCSYHFTYGEQQNFAGNTWELDNWVLVQLRKFFKSSGNPESYTRDGSFFFLHLLGQDTSGHTHKPHTGLYRHNLKNVDRIIKEVDELFARIYADNMTAFVLSADHGMTDWGSHGAGDPTETLTPIVAWGRGVKRNKNWDKVEIEQADVTPLLAVLLGVSIPVNSIGILPTKFLNLSAAGISEALLLNAEQISAQYAAIRSQAEERSSVLDFRHFSSDMGDIKSQVVSIKSDIKNGRFSEANDKIYRLIEISKEGISFYHNYYQRFLFSLVTISYICWILYLLIELVPDEAKPDNSVSLTGCACLATLSITSSFVLYRQQVPATFHAYVQLPVFILFLLIPKLSSLNKLWGPLTPLVVIRGLVLLVGIELFVVGFFLRWVWAFVLICIVIWGFLQGKRNSKLLVVWTSSGKFVALFTFLPVIGQQPQPILNLLSAMAISIAIFCYYFTHNYSKIGLFRTAVLLVAGLNSYLVHSWFQIDGGLNLFNQSLSWALLLCSCVLITRPGSNTVDKLASCFSDISLPFILLSISHESAFLLALFCHLTCWLLIEMNADDVVWGNVEWQQYTRPKLHRDSLTTAQVRKAYFFLAYIYIAFFGIGNLATLNSFDPAWVRCFVTTFSPYLMTCLILIKVLMPFLAVLVTFRAINLLTNTTPYTTFVLLLVYSNIMAVNFLFLVQNQGSWLDIGTSLSHYVIQQLALLFVLVLYIIAQLIMRDPLSRKDKPHFF